MDKMAEGQINARIFEFKTGVWKKALEEISAHIANTDVRIFDYYAPYRVSLEFLLNEAPYFRFTLFFRVFPPSPNRPGGSVKPSISLHRGNMEATCLERHFKELDKEIDLVTASEISELVKSLIDSGGLLAG